MPWQRYTAAGVWVRLAAEPGVSNRPLDVIPCRHQMQTMMSYMEDQISRPAPRTLTEVLDASARDIAAGHVGAAGAAQDEARRMLAEFEKARAGAGQQGHGTAPTA